MTIIFSVHQNCKTKKFAISKVSNKKFRKIHYFANIKFKRNSRKYCEKNLRGNCFVKRKIFAKKKFDNKIFTKKTFVEKVFAKKIFWKNKSKKIVIIILAIFLYLKKNSVNFRKKTAQQTAANVYCIPTAIVPRWRRGKYDAFVPSVGVAENTIH